MTLPRGFKANAEREAVRFREELSLPLAHALDPRSLAEHLAVKVVDGGELIGRDRFEELETLQAFAFSAATFEIQDRRFIATNPMRTTGRTNSDIAHELAHVILNHELSEIQEIAGIPFRTCKPDEEEQATAFGGTLLLPRPLLISAARHGLTSPDRIARAFDVSVDMARFRYNATGIAKQLTASGAHHR